MRTTLNSGPTYEGIPSTRILQLPGRLPEFWAKRECRGVHDMTAAVTCFHPERMSRNRGYRSETWMSLPNRQWIPIFRSPSRTRRTAVKDGFSHQVRAKSRGRRGPRTTGSMAIDRVASPVASGRTDPAQCTSPFLQDSRCSRLP